MIATIRRVVCFEAAHRLPHVSEGHKCGRMHGHSYRVTVRLRGPARAGSEAGMVCDFARVDALARELDHRTLNDVEGLTNPTSENVAAWFIRRLRADGLPVVDVAVAETDRSEAVVAAADVPGDIVSARAVALLSGGQDSTTCLYWARSRFAAVHAVSIDYGQRHRSELAAAEAIARMAGVTHEVLALPALSQLGGNALVSDVAVAATGGLGGMPSTFVPMRNVLFLTLAAARAVQWGATSGGDPGPAVVVCGACETDFSGYPDCRRSTMDATEAALSLAVDAPVRIETPLMALDKAATVRLARSLPGCWEALALSVTCYLGQRPGCGACPACVLRAKGFAETGERDPAGAA